MEIPMISRHLGKKPFVKDYRDKALKNYKKAIDKGLLKTFSKMGISTLQSYKGAQIFEAIGLKSTAEQSFQMLARGGTANIIGMIPVGTKIELAGSDFLGEKRIQGSMMGSNRFPIDMPRLVEFYMRGRLHLEDWISAKLKLSEINEGFAAMKAGKTVSKQALAHSLFGVDEEVNPDAIEIYVHRVRKKLEGGDAVIVTLRGLGYLLKPRYEQ